ncbi:MAG: hypothetical protein AAF617_07940 [Bacteroidota bacterium]
MKKHKYSGMLAILALLVMACSNDSEQVIIDNDVTLQQIYQLTDSYINAQDTATGNAKYYIDPELAAIDINATIDAYNEDSSDPDTYFAAGIAASYKASEGITPPNPSQGVDNASNPLDYVGKYHVDILHHQLTHKQNYIGNHGSFRYERSTEITRNLLQQYGENVQPSNTYTESSFKTYYRQLKQELQSVNFLLSEIILKMKDEGKITTVESQVLHAYFTMQESASSLSAYIQYSIQAEQIIVNSNYPQQTKDFLLFTMATARHDFNYWNQ